MDIPIIINSNEFPMLESISKEEVKKICLEIFKIGYDKYFLDREIKVNVKSILEQLHNIDYIK